MSVLEHSGPDSLALDSALGAGTGKERAGSTSCIGRHAGRRSHRVHLHSRWDERRPARVDDHALAGLKLAPKKKSSVAVAGGEPPKDTLRESGRVIFRWLSHATLLFLGTSSS